MARTTLGPNGLLEYETQYRVLICRECQYAIQKSAISSHLLRHKIYRDGRHDLLTLISQLDILEPEDVPLPTPDSKPVDLLPVIDGYCCTVPNCDNLCASEKRMRRHWSEVHGEVAGLVLANGARPTKLQTFFRGTKLRYFEVSSITLETNSHIPLPVSSTASGDEMLIRVQHGATATLDAPMCPPAPPKRVPGLSQAPIETSPISIDLDTLVYFNHFLTTTCLTLPGPQALDRPTHYWQTDVVLEALRQDWLMRGVLAISANHLAIFTDDVSTQKDHHKRFIQLFEEFNDRRPEMRCAHHLRQDTIIAGERVRCILRLARWALVASMLDAGPLRESLGSFQLHAFLADVRMLGVDAAVVHAPTFKISNNNFKDTFARATQTLSSTGFLGDESSTLLNRLSTLPTRMTEAFGRPNEIQEVLVTLSAIAALVEFTSLSYSSSDTNTTFQAVAMWLLKVPDRFNSMILQNSPAALVVVGHWVQLVKRAEDCGSWFLRGAATTISHEIAKQLPVDDAIQRLVDQSISL
ncbi:hypothetical protein BDV96DRAFT_643205 [Lophiotrema nucula]|uniref:C2H2-type domain-containing protein n=1 Tax=Lophiotrema nucula TaxID=690887 RepID=A0A6A5ZKT1_9PLEO|nr:hypothetical protein BDV96DRAFT_643205 [Lophiotrema nucula]